MSVDATEKVENAGSGPAHTSISRFDIRWLIASRFVVLSMMLLAASVSIVFYPEDFAGGLGFIYKPLAFFFLLTGCSALWLRKRGESLPFTYSQFAIDIVLVTFIVYVTGGPISPFLFLYLPIAMAAASLVSRTAALVVSALNGAVYSLLIAAILYGWILPADGSALVQTPSGGVFLQIVGLCSGMILVSVLTGFLTKVASSQYVLVEQQRRDILELSQRQRTLIDELPDGIITTDLNERIISLNQAAGNLLQLRKDVTGRPLAEVLKMLDPTFEVGETVASVPVPQREIELKKEDGSAGTNIVYQARSIATATGENNALIFVFQDITKLRSIEDQLAMQERMARLLAEKENRSLVSGTRLRDFVGESQLMQKVFNLIERVAPSDATVLVSGESGTGKELVARSIHLASQRCNGPFMAVNCGAIPENLIESELFGHKKGSFTGAEQDYAGIFRQADGGTLFLDEIGELPLQMQTKLLRTIQERTVRPIGGNKDIPISVRIIAATNRNLRKEVESGNFREDLFYRLNVINISLPALRQRKDDIPLLVNSILKGLVDRDVTPVVSPQAMSLLMNYDYPGNVRELENLLERAVVLGSEVILPEHLPETVTRFEGDGESKTLQETRIVIQDDINFPVELDKILADIERKYLEGALMRSNGAKKKAAQMLGINFRSFRYRLQKFGIAEEE